MRQINIDFDVHKAIEAERTGFDDSPNDVLRRVFGLGGISARDEEPERPEAGSWRDGEVILPPHTELKMSYNNQLYLAMVRDGVWVDDKGDVHHTPSGAACALARTKSGKKTNLNGKNYWYVKMPGSDWILYADLERKMKK